ncbi:MAG: CapA family protein [Saprospiraceae bacterium]
MITRKYTSFFSAVILGTVLAVSACSPRASKTVQATPITVEKAVLAKAELAELNAVEMLSVAAVRPALSTFPQIKAKPRAEFSLVAVGDMMLGTNYPDPKYLPPGDGSMILRDMESYLQNADITIGNLEGTLLNEGGTPKRCGNPDACYAFRSPESFAQHFANAGFDFLSLANNHSGDFGPIGRATTKRRLEEYGIAYAGLMGTDEIAYRTFQGVRFAFIAFAPNSGTVDVRDISRARRLVEQADAEAEIVIVTFHGGAEGKDAQHVTRRTEEYYKENRGNVYKFSHAVIDAGADAVLGHGPHVSRAMELYKDRIIAYSLGNFATYGRFNLRGPAGVAPLLKFRMDDTGRFISGEIVPIYQTKPSGPKVDPRGRAIKIIADLSNQDFPESPLRIGSDGSLSVPNL